MPNQPGRNRAVVSGLTQLLVHIWRPLSDAEITTLFALAKKHAVTLTIGYGPSLGKPTPGATLGNSVWTARGRAPQLVRFLWASRTMAKWSPGQAKWFRGEG